MTADREKRIGILDLWRSAAIILMIAYHVMYDLEAFRVLPGGFTARPLLLVLRYVCAGSFILISGAAVRFSRDPLRRGFLVFCVGLAVTVVSALVKLPVMFGILQLLGVCMMLCGLIGRRLDGKRGVVFLCLCTALFVGTWVLTDAITVDIKWLFPLGLKYEHFYSSDYYPLLPWGFLFLIGTALGEKLENAANSREYPRWTTFLGRCSLWIYVLHQPILYGLCKLIFD